MVRPQIALVLSCIAVIGTWPTGQAQGTLPGGADESLPPPVSRVREGGTPFDPQQSLTPFAVQLRDMPTSGLIASPPEYTPVRGVLFKYITGHWTATVTDCVVALTADPDHDEIAYVVVNSASQQTTATNDFIAHGADMSKVQFLVISSESVWLRDYGPHFIWQNGALGIVDSHYYPTRPLDNFIPTLIGDDRWSMPTYDIGLYYSGGNFQPGPERTAFVTNLVNVDNNAAGGFNIDLIEELYSTYQGIDTLHVMPQLPSTVDGTGHIDMWLYLVDEDTVIISQFKPGSNATAIQITNNAVPYMENLGYEVYRPWAWNAIQGGYTTHYTYTNAFRVNDRIFVPQYASGNPSYADEDADALDKWALAAGPDVEIVPIDCWDIIPAAGAIHCIVMQVPRHTPAVPSVHVIAPDGGELLVAGNPLRIEWVATDTDNVTIPSIALYYSLDDGASWNFIANSINRGFFDWTVPSTASPAARIKVVATAADSDVSEAVGGAFRIVQAQQTTYDFTSGAGVDKFGYGTQTSSWSSVNNIRRPVNTQLSAASYTKLALSDANGGDTDPNRYISPNPTTGWESTHVFELTIAEDPADIDLVKLLWEGYGDQCTQVELYAWDYTQGQWSNGAGLYGQNRYLDNWAGNRDGLLTGYLTSDFSRFIDASGQMTLLLYSERPTESGSVKPTFHDYLSVTVSRITQTLAGDMNCDDVLDFGDINAFVLALSNPESWQATYPDCYLLNGDVSGDGSFGFNDLNPFVALLVGG